MKMSNRVHITQNKKLRALGQLLLLSATMAWGISFTVLKDVISEVSMYYVIGVRFLVSTIILCLVFVKHFKNINKGTVLRGILLGTILTMAYLTQTWGLNNTTPGENAFLTSTYNIMCPFLLWAILKVKPKSYHLIAAVMCLIGIGMIAFSGNSGTNSGNPVLGYGFTLAAAVFFAFQIIVIDWAHHSEDDTMLTLIFELGVVGVVFTVLSLIIDLPNGVSAYALDGNQIVMLLILTFICTLYAQFAQVMGMRFTRSSQAAIILSLESVFGMLFSIIMGREMPSALTYVGFAIIFVAMLLTELKIEPQKLLFKKK